MMPYLNTQQQRLLLYLETCLVDQGGRVDGRKVNAAEHDQIDLWAELGFVRFGRLPAKEINGPFLPSYWVRFSDDAWAFSARYRRERGGRSLFMDDQKPIKARKEKPSCP